MNKAAPREKMKRKKSEIINKAFSSTSGKKEDGPFPAGSRSRNLALIS